MLTGGVGRNFQNLRYFRCPVWKIEKLIKSKPTRKLSHANSILEYFEYFCQMPSKSILIILSYTVSKLARFFWDTVYIIVHRQRYHWSTEADSVLGSALLELAKNFYSGAPIGSRCYCEHNNNIKMLCFHSTSQEIQKVSTYAMKSFQLLGALPPGPLT